MPTEWRTVDGTVLSAMEFATRGGTMYDVAFNYKVDGSWFGGTVKLNTAYAAGDSIPVEYDVRQPERNKMTLQARRTQVLAAAITAVVLALMLVGNALTH